MTSRARGRTISAVSRIAPQLGYCVIKALILLAAAALVCSARLAGAQSVKADVRSASDEAIVADTPAVDAAPHEARVRIGISGIDLSVLANLWNLPARGQAVGRWLDPLSFRIGSARLAAHANPGLPAIRRINRRFVPIPILEWRRHSPLVMGRGLMAIRPTIVIGRRLTWAPELSRGGRTIGLAVQVRVWLDAPPGAAPADVTSHAPARILSTMRGMLDGR